MTMTEKDAETKIGVKPEASATPDGHPLGTCHHGMGHFVREHGGEEQGGSHHRETPGAERTPAGWGNAAAPRFHVTSRRGRRLGAGRPRGRRREKREGAGAGPG